MRSPHLWGSNAKIKDSEQDQYKYTQRERKNETATKTVRSLSRSVASFSFAQIHLRLAIASALMHEKKGKKINHFIHLEKLCKRKPSKDELLRQVIKNHKFFFCTVLFNTVLGFAKYCSQQHQLLLARSSSLFLCRRIYGKQLDGFDVAARSMCLVLLTVSVSASSYSSFFRFFLSFCLFIGTNTHTQCIQTCI